MCKIITFIVHLFIYFFICFLLPPPWRSGNFAKDVEKATDPFMDRARQIKEEVNQATQDIKQNFTENQEAIQKKAGIYFQACDSFMIFWWFCCLEKLKEAGDRFTAEAIEIVEAEPRSTAYSLRGKNLYIVLGVIIAIAILVVFGKMNACMHVL